MSKFYGKLLPDYGDLDGVTSLGYRVFILEKDGGISLQMVSEKDDPTTTLGLAVFLNIEEAKDMLSALQEAIVSADSKSANHKGRAMDC